MRRRITIVLLALGTILGYGSGFAHIARAHHQCSLGRSGTPDGPSR